jgi:hypothetical protein
VRLCVAAALILAGCCSSAAAATLHADTFDADTLGWGGGGSPQFAPTGGAGDGGGFLRVPAGSNLATHNSAAQWIGDFAAIGADRIRVDLMAPAASKPLQIRVVLFGPSSTSERWTSALAHTVPNDGVWRHYTFPLGPSDIVPTQEYDPPITYAEVMASTLRVMLRHDPGDPSHSGEFDVGPMDELGIDNVELATAPPPQVGDFNNDGLVNGDDLNHATLGWRHRYGIDLDGDDFLDWQRHLSVPASGATAGVVPEPATRTLFLAAAALGIQRRRTKNTDP